MATSPFLIFSKKPNFFSCKLIANPTRRPVPYSELTLLQEDSTPRHASSTSAFSSSPSSFFQSRSTSPTHVNVYGSSPSASNIRFSLNNRQISPSCSIFVITRSNNSNQASKKQLDKPRRMCMCSPTLHPGKLFDEMPGDEFWSELKAIRWYLVSVDPPLTGLPWLVPDNTCDLNYTPVGEMRTETKLLPQCWEQISHMYEEGKLLVAQSCVELINRVEFIQCKSFLHRDIKPDNFLIGLGRRANQVYAIDFRLAKKYRDSSTHQHIPYRENKNLIGTTRYANMNPSLMKHKRSNIVGLPVSILLLKEDVTVTVVHPRTEDLESMIHEADIFIAAIGQPMMGSWIKVGLWLLMWG
ncbi:unnamed protein product [Lactuca saligna]|uniref:Tetrahydrofolate dehydrogenase/cyclohydrolase NAD(P)-binding domain-containing protein n=1 Tax=Lactuca saligna TaxID=75948 RepID=A0AA35ZM12_LACSI|nr:unnamed protein product [Lactuca saligna]